MKSSHRSKAIVISMDDFGEADRYVQFLTRDWGLISVLARSARKSRKRYVGGLDLFCHDEINVRGNIRETPYLVDLTVLNAFTDLREDLDKLLSAGKIIQWIKKLTRLSVPMPELYSLVGQSLALISRQEDTSQLAMLELGFKVKFLLQLGIFPSLESCTHCQKTLSHQGLFDLNSGSIVCQHCVKQEARASLISVERQDRLGISSFVQLRVSQWSQLEFESQPTKRMNQFVTQFACYQTQVRLPL